MNPWAVAADLLVAVHLAYVAFTVGGALAVVVGAVFGWRWVRRRWFRMIHLAAVLVVAVEALLGAWCPLTVWEWRLRRMAGQEAEEDISFVGRLIRKVVFVDLPDWGYTALYVGFGALVIVLLLAVRPEGRKGPGRTIRASRRPRRRPPPA